MAPPFGVPILFLVGQNYGPKMPKIVWRPGLRPGPCSFYYDSCRLMLHRSLTDDRDVSTDDISQMQSLYKPADASDSNNDRKVRLAFALIKDVKHVKWAQRLLTQSLKRQMLPSLVVGQTDGDESTISHYYTVLVRRL